MDNNDLFLQASEFLRELSQLGHGAQCETDNYINSAPCDCGLEAVKIKASTVIQDFSDAVRGDRS